MKFPLLRARSPLLTMVAALTLASSAGAQTIQPAPGLTAAVDAQKLPEDRGGNGLWQQLQKLHTWASVMMIVAHPDDEDGDMLTYESRGKGVRASLLTLTRGEGGQNLMSSDDYDALGLLRTNELLKADQYYGVDQYWTRVADYGFSKTIDEAFQQWGHDRVLYDVVRAVRMNRPMVLTSSFIGGITDGHGHHQASGEMAQEVFTAAGDPDVFPDQIRAGLRPWSPLKVYARVPFAPVTSQGMFDYATGKWAPAHFYNYVTKQWSDKAPEAFVEIPEGTYDPLLGRTYAQIARQGWGQQKTQNGGGYVVLPGAVSVGYHLYGSRVNTTTKENTYFDGIDTSLPGMAALAHGDTAFVKDGLREINKHVVNAMLGYIPSAPEKIAPELHDGYLATTKLIDQVNASALSVDDKANLIHELNIKLDQFNCALAQTLGLQIEALLTPEPKHGVDLPQFAEDTMQAATPSSDIYVRLHVSTAVNPQLKTRPRLVKTSLDSPISATSRIERIASPGLDDPQSLAGDVLFRATIAKNAPGTRPYFSRRDTAQSYYNIEDPRWLNRSFAPYPLEGWAEFDYDGVPIRIGQVVQTVHRVAALGSVEEPLVIAPGLSVGIKPQAGAVPLSAKEFPLTIKLHSNLEGSSDGSVRLDLPAEWTCDPPQAAFRLKTEEDTEAVFRVHPAALAQQDYTIKAIARSGNYEYSEGYRTVGYPGLRPYNYYRPATYRARGVDVKVAPGLRLGYVTGTGDEVPQALENLGIHPHFLTTADIATGDLSQYDTIVLGIRAYAARPELAANNARLLEFVHNGGTLFVQYNSGEFDRNYGPYPYVLGSSPEKVVDESAPVTLLSPDDPLFTWPNRITPADFNGWIEERGHSFMLSWDSHYFALTEVHDPGQDPQRGGLLMTKYGKGIYIYAAFALYRQLPEAVPGAYRILANLVSAGKAH